jgi:hypothetical protein
MEINGCPYFRTRLRKNTKPSYCESDLRPPKYEAGVLVPYEYSLELARLYSHNSSVFLSVLLRDLPRWRQHQTAEQFEPSIYHLYAIPWSTSTNQETSMIVSRSVIGHYTNIISVDWELPKVPCGINLQDSFPKNWRIGNNFVAKNKTKKKKWDIREKQLRVYHSTRMKTEIHSTSERKIISNQNRRTWT